MDSDEVKNKHERMQIIQKCFEMDLSMEGRDARKARILKLKEEWYDNREKKANSCLEDCKKCEIGSLK